ncbi:MAG: hypothetical protein CVV24_06200 [Ignavibacteriae bacterium HGW-Ignavibacteriae-3]|nr:MAG: hypothetical protein CVV24_06200 [Ignavibacteriae bacterium HGW-Ignavibacteriae-3]
MNKLIFTVLIIILSAANFYSQSSINPDISLIGRFNTFTNFIKGTSEYGKLNFADPEMELFVDGYLNPFAKAAANLAYEENVLGVEELYGHIVRGLPFDMQIKAGKFLVGFGKLNTVHPHAWAFMHRPLFHQVFFGEGGFNDVGINFSFLLPTGDLFTTLDLGVFKGNSVSALTDPNAVDRGINPLIAGRLGSFISLDDYTNLEVGLSSSFGIFSKGNINSSGNIFADPEQKSFNYFYGGIDFKFKYSPDAYTILTIQGEGLLNNRDALGLAGTGFNSYREIVQKITNSGAFLYADYKFEKQFSLGIKYDYTAGIAGDTPNFYSLANDDKNSTQGIEAWFSYYPAEETTVLRLGVQHLSFNYADGTNRDGETTIKLQFMFSLGPHKAHPF